MKLFSLLLVLICAAELAQAQPTIFIVRHAEKAQSGDTKDPELSDAGHARAESLATLLKDAGIAAIYATEFKRTQQTVEPLARALQVEATTVPAKDTAALTANISEVKGNVLIAAHSNTIPEILRALGAPMSFTIEEPDYDNLLVLTPGSLPQLLRLHYR